jgi:LPS sulfotransferase NodH
MHNATQRLVTEPLLKSSRSTAPVFVVGCPRSGTTYLYHLLLSAGNFAIYRTESQVFHMLEPRFGDLSVSENKKRLLAAWFNSRLFTATGLDAQRVEEKMLRECRDGGDFLRIVMEEMALHQGVQRWADCTPDHVLYLARIKQTIPNALVIQIIRDGRDVALSMEKQSWPKQLPWDKTERRMAGGLYWEWMTCKGRRDGAQLGADYFEVRYEDLVSRPREVLAQLSAFIGQELDYDQIQKVAIGSVSKPNSSFQGESSFVPVDRWKKFYTSEQLAMFDGLVGETLEELGYQPSTGVGKGSVGLALFRAQYRALFETKHYARTKTPLGRLMITRDLSKM